MEQRFEHAELVHRTGDIKWKVFPGSAVGADGPAEEFGLFRSAKEYLEKSGWEMVFGFVSDGTERIFWKRPFVPVEGGHEEPCINLD